MYGKNKEIGLEIKNLKVKNSRNMARPIGSYDLVDHAAAPYFIISWPYLRSEHEKNSDSRSIIPVKHNIKFCEIDIQSL